MRLLQSVCVPLALAMAASAFAQETAELPPLTDPPGERLPGKFVWADLITSDIEAARNFYQQLFALDWVQISGPPSEYGILEHNGYPVAGIAYRPQPEGASAPGHWVHYVSVRDVDAALRAVEAAGGSSLLAPQDYEARGRLAIVAGPNGDVLGLLRSSAGDPPDYRAERGDWIWWELLTHDVAESARIFASVCGCDVTQDSQQSGRYLAVSQGFVRAAVGPLSDPDVDAIWLGFVRVSDVAGTVEAARRLGAEILVAPGSSSGDGDLAVVQDPAGGILGLLDWAFSADAAAP